MSCGCSAACHTGGGNSVLSDHTLQKAAIEKYLDGGLNISAIVYQVGNLTAFCIHMAAFRIYSLIYPGAGSEIMLLWAWSMIKWEMGTSGIRASSLDDSQ